MHIAYSRILFLRKCSEKMCKEHTIPKYPSIINHKKPFYVNVNGEKEEISISLQRTKHKSIKESSDNRSFKLSCFLVNMQKMDIK